MKTTLFYGAIMGFVGILLNYALYFLGFHDSAAKMQSSQMINAILGIISGTICLVLAARARRQETPASEPFGYGRALLACFLTSLWSVCIGTLSWVIYIGVVNPGVRDIMIQGELAKLEAKGVSSAQIEQAEGMIRMMMGPIPQGLIGFCIGLIIWTLISLIVAAFVRRTAADPAVAA
jgi:hypothetical protein